MYSNHSASDLARQPTALQLKRVSSTESTTESATECEYYLCCDTAPRRTRWEWYDNHSATYKAYTMGPEVDAQLEVSFQANVHFAAAIGHHFSNVNFNALKRAIAAQSGECVSRRRSKQFLLRFRMADGEIVSVEQIAVQPRPYSTFPRVVRRIEKQVDCQGDGYDLEL